jgi:hypothetical protein
VFLQKYISLIFGFLALYLNLYSNSVYSSKYGMDFYRMGVGARAEGLGGACTAVVEDVTSIYWNPAGLSSVRTYQMHAMHSERFAGAVNLDFLGVALPFAEKSAIGVGLYRMGIDGIPITRLANPTKQIGEMYTDAGGMTLQNVPYVDRYVNDQELALVLTYSIRKTDRLAFGINLKSIHKSVGDYSAWGLGFDLGAILRPYRELRLGVVLKDATSTLLAWREGRTEAVLPRLRVGIGYPVSVMKINLLPVLDTEMGLSRLGKVSQISTGSFDFEFHLGLEVQYSNRIALRVGMNQDRLTIGTGFHFSIFSIDYSFYRHSDLGDCHRISATLIWDKNRLLSL